jgi:translation initiation factor 2B subunit (eIF-2B alpha/beta/delta family)
LQGARLTTWELNRAGIKVTLICDSMAATVMKNGWISACLVGFDCVAKNGDVANKVGTAGLAILAKHFNIPFYALGPTSSVDLSCAAGENIEIELRDPEEIKTMHYAQPMAPRGFHVTTPPLTSRKTVSSPPSLRKKASAARRLKNLLPALRCNGNFLLSQGDRGAILFYAPRLLLSNNRKISNNGGI